MHACLVGGVAACAAADPREFQPELRLPPNLTDHVEAEFGEWQDYRSARAKNRRRENRQIGAMAAIAVAQSAATAVDIATVAKGTGAARGGTSLATQLSGSSGASAGASDPGATEAPNCASCTPLSEECESDPVPHQRSCYCAAACLCDCYGEAECAANNRASAAKVGTGCGL
jgi:hypothetical protein